VRKNWRSGTSSLFISDNPAFRSKAPAEKAGALFSAIRAINFVSRFYILFLEIAKKSVDLLEIKATLWRKATQIWVYIRHRVAHIY
jgi:hypothetical protein